MLSKDFKEFIESLNENQVKYLVVGGYRKLGIAIIPLKSLMSNAAGLN